MKYKAIIFDLDGVICSTDEFHYEAWKQIADCRGITFNQEMNNMLRGVSRNESLNIILRQNGISLTNQEKEAIVEEKNKIYQEKLKKMNHSFLKDSTRNTLETLRSRGIKLAIGSSSKNTKLILKQIGLEGFFDAVSDGTNITRSKPDPEVFCKAADFLREQPSDCLVVEDAQVGIEAAFKGGFDSAGLNDANNNVNVTYKLKEFEDLVSI